MNDKDDTLRNVVRSAIVSQPRPTITVLSSLLAIQDKLGYVPSESIEVVADYTHTTINDVFNVVSFYTNFRTDPPLAHTVEICWGPTCHMLGAPQIIAAVQRQLGLTTEGNNKVADATLKYNTCLGACAQAPVMSINHQLFGRLSPGTSTDFVQKITGIQSPYSKTTTNSNPEIDDSNSR